MIKYLFTDKSRLLTLDEVEGKSMLKLFKEIGLRASYTDFTSALGGEVYRDIMAKPECSAIYQIKSDNGLRQAVVGDHIQHSVDTPFFGTGVRMAMNIPFEKEGDIQRDENGIPYVYFGEYPQTVANNNIKFIIQNIKDKTGFRYIVPNTSAKRNAEAIEYYFQGEKYVLLDITNLTVPTVLSNGREIQNGDTALFNVEPIKWLLDEQTGIMVSEKVLSTNIPYEYMNTHEADVKRLIKGNKGN